MSKRIIAIALFIITVGVAWLLDVMTVIPRVDWLWTLTLGLAGLMTFLFGGLTRVTFVLGPALFLAAIFSFLRQTGRLRADLELPILFIVIGVLMLIGHLFQIGAVRTAPPPQ